MTVRKAAYQNTGMALGSVLILMLLISLSLLMLANFAISGTRMSVSGRDKTIALSLAEAGIDDTVDQIRLDNAYSGTSSPSTITNADGTTSGTFSVRVVTIDRNQRDVFSTGRTLNGKSCQVYARVKLSGDPNSAAILSNGNVVMNSASKVLTSPLGSGNANVYANGNISMAPATNVDGRVGAAGRVTNGKSTDPLFPNGQDGAPRTTFPMSPEITAMTNQWITEAKSGTSTTGDITTSALIMANRYINGSISIPANKTLAIGGTGTVFVTGNITIKGNLYVASTVTLVVAGTFTMEGSSDSRAVSTLNGVSETASRATLVSLSTNLTNAITLRASADCDAFSTLYAVNGGITAENGATGSAQLKAGGVGSTVTLGGSFELNYPSGSSKYGNNPTVASWVELN